MKSKRMGGVDEIEENVVWEIIQQKIGKKFFIVDSYWQLVRAEELLLNKVVDLAVDLLGFATTWHTIFLFRISNFHQRHAVTDYKVTDWVSSSSMFSFQFYLVSLFLTPPLASYYNLSWADWQLLHMAAGRTDSSSRCAEVESFQSTINILAAQLKIFLLPLELRLDCVPQNGPWFFCCRVSFICFTARYALKHSVCLLRSKI